MARTKSTRSASTSSKSTRSPKSASSARSTSKKASASTESEDSLAAASFGKARDFVESNANLQSAGIALAGAGILALVSTQAGRNLIKTATDAVVKIASQQYSQFTGTDKAEADTNTNQRSSRQRDQARV